MFDEENLISLAIFLSFCLCPQYVQPWLWGYVFFANFLCFFAKQIEAKFREKSENFCIFSERTKCKNKAKWSQKKIFAKNVKFLRNQFSFSLETLDIYSGRWTTYGRFNYFLSVHWLKSWISDSAFWTTLIWNQLLQRNFPTISTNQRASNIGFINLLAETELGFIFTRIV